jgi:hypothetical protein
MDEKIDALLSEGFEKLFRTVFHLWHTHKALDNTTRRDVALELQRLRAVFENIIKHGYYDVEYDDDD